MPLESDARLMEAAQDRRYALGYFESWNLESLQGVIDAAEGMRSPTIIGFSAEFLSQRKGATPEDLALYAALGVAAAAKTAKVPCARILKKRSRDAWVERDLGWIQSRHAIRPERRTGRVSTAGCPTDATCACAKRCRRRGFGR